MSPAGGSISSEAGEDREPSPDRQMDVAGAKMADRPTVQQVGPVNHVSMTHIFYQNPLLKIHMVLLLILFYSHLDFFSYRINNIFSVFL